MPSYSTVQAMRPRSRSGTSSSTHTISPSRVVIHDAQPYRTATAARAVRRGPSHVPTLSNRCKGREPMSATLMCGSCQRAAVEAKLIPRKASKVAYVRRRKDQINRAKSSSLPPIISAPIISLGSPQPSPSSQVPQVLVPEPQQNHKQEDPQPKEQCTRAAACADSPYHPFTRLALRPDAVLAVKEQKATPFLSSASTRRPASTSAFTIVRLAHRLSSALVSSASQDVRANMYYSPLELNKSSNAAPSFPPARRASPPAQHGDVLTPERSRPAAHFLLRHACSDPRAPSTSRSPALASSCAGSALVGHPPAESLLSFSLRTSITAPSPGRPCASPSRARRPTNPLAVAEAALPHHAPHRSLAASPCAAASPPRRSHGRTPIGARRGTSSLSQLPRPLTSQHLRCAHPPIPGCHSPYISAPRSSGIKLILRHIIQVRLCPFSRSMRGLSTADRALQIIYMDGIVCELLLVMKVQSYVEKVRKI
ncbi:hypothetical protein B0H17DRAFT_1149029 [Mycena rosella]|uniref:Uncharacterized protein n=1 Tax=Mycena rosella TaxID=1033263 RepID=A0AAD7C6A0_MYCRO|nr:hypothetical protein B0H17DRAFT_1149029 [Mycena rosella]